MSIVSVVVVIIIVGVLLYVVQTVIPMDAKVRVVLQAVVVIALLLWLLDVFGIYHFSGLRLR